MVLLEPYFAHSQPSIEFQPIDAAASHDYFDRQIRKLFIRANAVTLIGFCACLLCFFTKRGGACGELFSIGFQEIDFEERANLSFSTFMPTTGEHNFHHSI
jgi:hypothetical protein